VQQVLPAPISETPRRGVVPDGACKICSNPLVEERYDFPLCWDCRYRLSRRAFPRVVLFFCALVVMAAAYAGTFYPETLRATVAYQLGQRAERAGHYTQAIDLYETALKTFPESNPALAHLGITYYHSGNTPQATWVLGTVLGQDMPQGLSDQVNSVLAEIKKKAGVQ